MRRACLIMLRNRDKETDRERKRERSHFIQSASVNYLIICRERSISASLFRRGTPSGGDAEQRSAPTRVLYARKIRNVAAIIMRLIYDKAARAARPTFPSAVPHAVRAADDKAGRDRDGRIYSIGRTMLRLGRLFRRRTFRPLGSSQVTGLL